jgi:Uma2 family endonuclease
MTMSVWVSESRPVPAPHRKITVEEYHRMAEMGILGADERVELIEGELIDMPPIGPVHAGLANRLIRFFAPRLHDRATVSVGNPIRAGRHSEPQPDFALLRYRADDYASALPLPEDVLLAVEIADTTVKSDRRIKKPLYARHGIPEYWIVNLPHRQIEVHLDPDPEQSRYRETRTYSTGLLAPACFPDLALDVAELLG